MNKQNRMHAAHEFLFLCYPEALAEGLHLFNLERDQVFMYYNILTTTCQSFT